MSPFAPDLLARAAAILDLARTKNAMLATVESCTGGLIAAAFTEIAGSSTVVERGFVTYSNEAKTELVGVPAAMIRAHGAVSEQVARAMAEGALRAAPVDIAVAVTGVAGPGGGSPEKPVGLVHFACAAIGRPMLAERREFGDLGRGGIRIAAISVAFDLLERQLDSM